MKVPAGRPAHLQKQTYYLKNIWATKRAVTLLLCALVAFNVVFVPFQVLIFLFFFFFYYPVLSPFTITTASGDPICHIIFGGITTQRGKKNFDLFLSFTKQGCYTFIFFSGVLFCYPLLPWFCWPFPFSPFCSYRLTFITASTHALSSNHRSHHQSSSLACLEVTYPRFFSFLICFPIMHGTTTIHEKC